MWILQSRQSAFAEAFYRFHEKRTKQMLFWATIQISVAVAFVGLGFWQLFYGKGVLLPGLFTATFLVLLASCVVGTIDQLRVRVLPYFEKRLGDTDTWLSGRTSSGIPATSMNWQSFCHSSRYRRSPPETTSCEGKSCNSSIPKRRCRLLEKLILRSKGSRFPKDLVSDLTALRDALKSASEKGVRFCLLLREGSTASGNEMSLRKGSFF